MPGWLMSVINVQCGVSQGRFLAYIHDIRPCKRGECCAYACRALTHFIV